MGTLHPSYIVGVGGSAGSLSAFKALLEAMPSDTGMAFIVVAHLPPAGSSLLDQVLMRHTDMQVILASSGMQVHANRVYVIPPNADLFIKRQTLGVVSPPERMSRQVDCLLISMAEHWATHAVGIILSGYLQDGTLGCRHIKANGGTTFAQDHSAEASSMPLMAQASGSIDFVLPPQKMPEELIKLLKS